ncbi:MAG: PTS sugar transporter subunit IIA [Alphaproteobacteria bacterium]|nr:PTS sugar transporter subunit IIA [Alphaproteobacteria bacterium]
MLGIVLVGHNDLAESMKSVAEHVVGALPDVVCVSVLPTDDIEEKRQEIFQKIKQVDKGKGVVLLTDMFGGTPSNLAISLMQEGKVEVISGMNIPMIVKLVRMRKKKLMDAVIQSAESGQHYIMVASEFLGKKNDDKSKS